MPMLCKKSVIDTYDFNHCLQEMHRPLAKTRRLQQARDEARQRRVEENMCAICLQPCFRACEQCVNGHKFHIKCMQRAFPNRTNAQCPVCRRDIYQLRQLRPRPVKPEDLVFNYDEPFELDQGGLSHLERLGAGVLLLEPNAIATEHARPISSLPRYQTNVAIYWFGRVQRGDLWIDGDIIWYHHADQDVTNDPSARNPTLSWGETRDTVKPNEANGQPVLAEARSGDPVIYLGDGREEPVENYRRGRDNSCCIL